MKKLKIFFDKNKNFRFEGIGILVHESEWIEKQMNMNFFPNFIIYTNFSFSCHFFHFDFEISKLYFFLDRFVRFACHIAWEYIDERTKTTSFFTFLECNLEDVHHRI